MGSKEPKKNYDEAYLKLIVDSQRIHQMEHLTTPGPHPLNHCMEIPSCWSNNGVGAFEPQASPMKVRKLNLERGRARYRQDHKDGVKLPLIKFSDIDKHLKIQNEVNGLDEALNAYGPVPSADFETGPVLQRQGMSMNVTVKIRNVSLTFRPFMTAIPSISKEDSDKIGRIGNADCRLEKSKAKKTVMRQFEIWNDINGSKNRKEVDKELKQIVENEPGPQLDLVQLRQIQEEQMRKEREYPNQQEELYMSLQKPRKSTKKDQSDLNGKLEKQKQAKNDKRVSFSKEVQSTSKEHIEQASDLSRKGKGVLSDENKLKAKMLDLKERLAQREKDVSLKTKNGDQSGQKAQFEKERQERLKKLAQLQSQEQQTAGQLSRDEPEASHKEADKQERMAIVAVLRKSAECKRKSAEENRKGDEEKKRKYDEEKRRKIEEEKKRKAAEDKREKELQAKIQEAKKRREMEKLKKKEEEEATKRKEELRKKKAAEWEKESEERRRKELLAWKQKEEEQKKEAKARLEQQQKEEEEKAAEWRKRQNELLEKEKREREQRQKEKEEQDRKYQESRLIEEKEEQERRREAQLRKEQEAKLRREREEKLFASPSDSDLGCADNMMEVDEDAFEIFAPGDGDDLLPTQDDTEEPTRFRKLY